MIREGNLLTTCKKCAFWFRYESGYKGECRRYAPKPLNNMSKDTYWPEVASEDWCGEWKKGEHEAD